MKRLLQTPVTNAVFIACFTAFYAAVFIATSRSAAFSGKLFYFSSDAGSPFWTGWSRFLERGGHAYIAYFLLAVTAAILVLLLRRHKPYDEYQLSVLLRCFTVAIALTLVAIAVFFLLVLADPSGIVEKFFAFIVINWTTVVFADLTYVLICRWR